MDIVVPCSFSQIIRFDNELLHSAILHLCNDSGDALAHRTSLPEYILSQFVHVGGLQSSHLIHPL